MAKERVDKLLVERGLAETRERAQRLVMAGLVFSGDVAVDKPGTRLAVDTPLDVRGEPHPFVSRGGAKLDATLAALALDVRDLVALDVGASTGGFTEVLLDRGAARVLAVDVGRDQLHPSLRVRPEVVVMEATDIRALALDAFPARPDLAVVDVSFIPLAQVLPAVSALVARPAALVALIKPQFEAGRAHLKKGIVRDAAVQQEVCDRIADLVARLGWTVAGTIPSPIAGGDGNREFLIGATRD